MLKVVVRVEIRVDAKFVLRGKVRLLYFTLLVDFRERNYFTPSHHIQWLPSS